MFFSQQLRTAFNQNEINPMCLLCTNEVEDLQHFLLTCVVLEAVSKPILNDLETECSLVTGRCFKKNG